MIYNNIQWLEIPIKNEERATQFYSNVFNIKFEYIEMPDNKMYMFGETEKVGSPGALVLSGLVKPSKDGATIYFSCENIENSIKLAQENGAQVLVDITDIGELGKFAHILDSEGNRIGLHTNN